MKLPCKCCHWWHGRDMRWGWVKWGGRLKGPICMECKVVGCEKCA